MLAVKYIPYSITIAAMLKFTNHSTLESTVQVQTTVRHVSCTTYQYGKSTYTVTSDANLRVTLFMYLFIVCE